MKHNNMRDEAAQQAYEAKQVREEKRERELDAMVDYQQAGFNRLVEQGMIVPSTNEQLLIRYNAAMELVQTLFDVIERYAYPDRNISEIRGRYEKLRDDTK